MKHKVDILNLEWETDSRDSNIVDPVLVSLEDRYGYTVQRASIWQYFSKILWYRPRILLIANDIGATPNFLAFYFADKLGIQTISLISEGLPQNGKNKEKLKDLDVDFFWGNNIKHIKVWDLKLLWSELSKKRCLSAVPGAEQFNLKVSGGTGFDRYHLLKFDKKEWIKKNSLHSHKKFILIVGYGFDTPYFMNIYEDNLFDWLYSQRLIVREIYDALIKRNPEIFFILKNHPGSACPPDGEFAGIAEKYDNAMELRKGVATDSLINVADIIIAFDSTVCMEAWLLDKPTILVNPCGTEFPRPRLHEGSVIVQNNVELQNLLDEYYTTGEIQSFAVKKEKRSECIEELIQFGDGANYLRASKLINDYLTEHKSKKASITGVILIEMFLRILRDFATILIEKTALGFLKKDMKYLYQKRRKLYNKKLRQSSVNQYREGINKFENTHKELVDNIICNYMGE